MRVNRILWFFKNNTESNSFVFDQFKFTNAMKIMITQLVLLPLTIAASVEDYFPNPQYDATTFQVNAIYDLLRILDKETLKNAFDEWITQHQRSRSNVSSVFNESKNVRVNFSEFIPDEDIVPISRLIKIHYNFGYNITFTFQPEKKKMYLEGNVQFFHPGNQSSCQIAFNLNFILLFYGSTIDHMFNITNNELYFEMPPIKKKKFTQTELDKNSCAKINEEDRQFTYHYVLQAIETVMIERIKLIQRSVFLSMLKRFHLDIGSNGYRKKLYSRFTTDGNAAEFPWKSDYDELIIRGLDNLKFLTIEFKFVHSTTYLIRPLYDIYFRAEDVKIHWYIASMNLTQTAFDVTELSFHGEFTEFMDDLEIIFVHDVVELDNHDYTKYVNKEVLEKFKELLTNGIQRTLRKTSYDGTTRFTSDMKKILRPFDETGFKNSFIDPKNPEQKIYQSCMISFSKIEIEEFHLGNIKWNKYNNLEIGNGTLIYKKMEGQSNITYIIKNNLLGVPISAHIRMKQATIGISLQNDLNWILRINDDFDKADTIIQITSRNYSLQQKERVEIGKYVFEYFVEKIKGQTINRIKSIFRPIFGISKDSMDINIGNSARSNQFNKQRRYFTLIHDHWPVTVRSLQTYPVEIFIDGVWNFDSINVQYVNDKLLIAGLRLENITASIKQLDESNKTLTKNLTIKYLSMNINHTEKQISITNPSNFHILSRMPIFEFRSTVAFFIEYTIYGDDSNYRTILRKFVDKTMTQVIHKDAPYTYDVPNIFAKNLARILKNKTRSFLGPLGYFYLKISDFNSSKNDYSILTAARSNIMPQNTKISRCVGQLLDEWFTQTEICIYFQNAYSIAEQLTISGRMEMDCQLPHGMTIHIPFVVTSSDREMKTFNYYYNKNLQIYINDENIMRAHRSVVFDPTNRTTTTELAILTSRHLRDLLEKFSNIDNFCKPSFSAITPLNEYFFSIKGTIDYPAQRFLMYHIKLYGLHRLISLRMYLSEDTEDRFEITIGNLNARIIWNYYTGEMIQKTPKIMNLWISNITLCGTILLKKRFVINERSQMHFSELEDYSTVTNLIKTFKPIVLDAIMKSIQKEYEHN